MLAACPRRRLDSVTICEDWFGGFTRFFVRPARSIILAVFMVALTLGGAAAQNPAATDSNLEKLKINLDNAVESLKAYAGNGADIADNLTKVQQELDKIGLIRRQAFLKERSDALKVWLDETQVIKSDPALIKSLTDLTNTAASFEALDRSGSAQRRAQRLLDVLGEVMLWPSDPAKNALGEVLKKLEELEATRPIPALLRRAPLLMDLVANNTNGIKTTSDIVEVLLKLQTRLLCFGQRSKGSLAS